MSNTNRDNGFSARILTRWSTLQSHVSYSLSQERIPRALQIIMQKDDGGQAEKHAYGWITELAKQDKVCQETDSARRGTSLGLESRAESKRPPCLESNGAVAAARMSSNRKPFGGWLKGLAIHPLLAWVGQSVWACREVDCHCATGNMARNRTSTNISLPIRTHSCHPRSGSVTVSTTRRCLPACLMSSRLIQAWSYHPSHSKAWIQYGRHCAIDPYRT
jgi:hypothetical protein